MKAVIHSKYGNPEYLKIEEVATPKPQNGEVLVKIMACTVNRTDCALLRAKPSIVRLFTGLTKPKNNILGTDFAGIIEAVGSNVSKFKAGDKVFGFNDMGLSSHAEYLTIRETEALALIPDKVNYEQAAASIEGLHYAQNMINKVNLKAGEKALVIGGTGAIGSACIQLLITHHIAVDSVCQGQYAEKVKAFGSDRIYDYEKEDFTQTEIKYNYVFDAVGKSTFKACKSILSDKGVYISSELGPGNENIYLPLLTKLKGNKRVKFPFPSNLAFSVNLAKQLMEQGKFTPLIDQSYTLDNVVEAFNHVESGQKIGNVIIMNQA